MPEHDLTLIERSMFNLTFIEQRADDQNGPYDVTQLINTLLLVLVVPNATWLNKVDETPISQVSGFEGIRVVKGDTTLRQVLRRVRNGVAHGSFKFIGTKNQITSIVVKDLNAFEAEVSVSELRKLVHALHGLWKSVS
ncbi:MAG: hypothetical protein JSS66_11055 [Armatimonadetes bacterium]|nr:hypothetical protein [Armatimonadota bacterium]